MDRGRALPQQEGKAVLLRRSDVWVLHKAVVSAPCVRLPIAAVPAHSVAESAMVLDVLCVCIALPRGKHPRVHDVPSAYGARIPTKGTACQVPRKVANSLQMAWWTLPSPASPEQMAVVRGSISFLTKSSNAALVTEGGGGGLLAGS